MVTREQNDLSIHRNLCKLMIHMIAQKQSRSLAPEVAVSVCTDGEISHLKACLYLVLEILLLLRPSPPRAESLIKSFSSHTYTCSTEYSISDVCIQSECVTLLCGALLFSMDASGMSIFLCSIM